MDIAYPTLLIDKTKCLRNIQRMAEKAKQHKVSLRPHFKTHISAEIGSWFKDFGVDKITVSSPQMASYFASHGWQDITIAFPVNINTIQDLNEIKGLQNLNLTIEASKIARHLDKYLTRNTGIYLKIDTGNHRTGIHSNDGHTISEILEVIRNSPKLFFKGFLAHAGHSYAARTKEAINEIHLDTIHQMRALKRSFCKDWPELELSIGDTPCCSVAEDFESIDEIRPGNFVFYDVMQSQIGSCTFEDIAVCLAVPVISTHKKRNELVVHGGAIHLSKDRIKWGNEDIYGLVVRLDENGWSSPIDGMLVTNLSQEHGIIRCSKDVFKLFALGDLLGILPIHSCLTADLMRSYATINGERIPAMKKP